MSVPLLSDHVYPQPPVRSGVADSTPDLPPHLLGLSRLGGPYWERDL